MTKEFNIEKALGFIIYRTALAMRGAMHRALRGEGFEITPEQYGILLLLREEEGLSQKEIGNVLFKDKPNISRMLDVLERKSLILRQPADRRKFSIFLTEAGKKLAEEILPVGLKLREQAVNGLLARELEILAGLLNKIYENIS